MLHIEFMKFCQNQWSLMCTKEHRRAAQEMSYLFFPFYGVAVRLCRHSVRLWCAQSTPVPQQTIAPLPELCSEPSSFHHLIYTRAFPYDLSHTIEIRTGLFLAAGYVQSAHT